MKTKGMLFYLLQPFLVTIVVFALYSNTFAADKTKIMIVSSYHKQYLWSQDTNKGVCQALIDFKFFDSEDDSDKFTENDFVETKRAIVKKLWMDTKRKTSRSEIAKTVGYVIREVDAFKPDILLLGDDNAVRYIGKHYIDTDIPVVFWGVNGLPLKYGLLDSIERPGHNVTGVYQSGYLQEGLSFLTKLIPSVKKFAILSDDSPTGRSKAKDLNRMAKEGQLSVNLVEMVITNSFSEWKKKALELNEVVDAFFVLNHNTLKDDKGVSIGQMEAGAWYLNNVKKPDVGHEKQFVEEGMLCAVDDSGFKQGYEAVKIAYMILVKGKDPAFIASYAPKRGKFLVNRQRAKMLGLTNIIENNPIIEGYIEKALALEPKSK